MRGEVDEIGGLVVGGSMLIVGIGWRGYRVELCRVGRCVVVVGS